MFKLKAKVKYEFEMPKQMPLYAYYCLLGCELEPLRDSQLDSTSERKFKHLFTAVNGYPRQVYAEEVKLRGFLPYDADNDIYFYVKCGLNDSEVLVTFYTQESNDTHLLYCDIDDHAGYTTHLHWDEDDLDWYDLLEYTKEEM